jgi:hypothetical protein
MMEQRNPIFSRILHLDPLKNNFLMLPGGQGCFFLSGLVFLERPLASAGGCTLSSPGGPGWSAIEVFDITFSYQTIILTLLATKSFSLYFVVFLLGIV